MTKKLFQTLLIAAMLAPNVVVAVTYPTCYCALNAISPATIKLNATTKGLGMTFTGLTSCNACRTTCSGPKYEYIGFKYGCFWGGTLFSANCNLSACGK